VIIRAIVRTRELILPSEPQVAVVLRTLPWDGESNGWSVLTEIPCPEVVVGTVTRPWDAMWPSRQFQLKNSQSSTRLVVQRLLDAAGQIRSALLIHLARTETRLVTIDAVAPQESSALLGIGLPRHLLDLKDLTQEGKARSGALPTRRKPSPGL
jgi:hypothetical protein